MYDWETFTTAYHAATADEQAIVDSGVVLNCCQQAVEKYQLDESHYRPLVKLLGLYILGALGKAIVVNEMRKLGIPESELVFSSITDCIESTPITPDHEQLAKDLEEAEAALDNTQPDDLPKKSRQEVVHHSNQSDLLQKKNAPTMPIPRWDTD